MSGLELRQIKDLMAAMRRHGMTRLSYEDESCKLELEQNDGTVVREVVTHPHLPAANPLPVPAAPVPQAEPEEKAAASTSEPAGKAVTSPIVGTFYSASSPDAPPFVKVGDKVDANTVVCIVEAMKVMNEVKAGVSGTVAEVLVDNGNPVEFGTKLFRVV